jgi:hypothetical protein
MKSMPLRFIISVLCPAMFFSCASLGAGDSRLLWQDRRARDPSVYFVQVQTSSSVSRQDSAIFERAAAQIFMRKQVFVRYTVSMADSGQRRDSFTVDFDRGNVFPLSEQLEILARSETATDVQALVRFRAKSPFSGAALSVKDNLGKDGNPVWVSIPPQLKGFYTAVGAVPAGSVPADGFMNSDSCAIASLAVSAGKPFKSGTTTMYEASLEGAYVLRRWYNPNSKIFYSLACVPRGLMVPAK